MSSSSGLRPLQLPLLVERRRKQEEEAAATSSSSLSSPVALTVVVPDGTTEDDVSCTGHQWRHQETHQRPHMTSSDMTSPVTPTFSARRPLRYSSSMTLFDLGTPASCEDMVSSLTQAQQMPNKRILDDVEEEPFEYDRFDYYVGNVDLAYETVSDHFDLYDYCLCDEPCMHRDSGVVRSRSNFFTRGRNVEYGLECLSDGDSPRYPRVLRRKNRTGSMPALKGLSHRLGSHLPSFTRWKSPRKSSTSSSPGSDLSSERRSMSCAASSRSSSVSGSNWPFDRSNEAPRPPTPALSFESCDSITLPGPLDAIRPVSVLSSIQRERALATTPLLPPIMTGNSADHVAAKVVSPLQSPTIASPVEDESQSLLLLSPVLSSRPSISSMHHLMASSELPLDTDVWSNLLGHANFTILPVPYKPENTTLASLHELRADWEMARVNYTKHLVRTGEHYGLTSKTYAYTEEKWAETDRTWRKLHDEIVDAIVASGEETGCGKFDEVIMTTVPRMYGEGKFPERGDEDIVGPMVREAMMNSPERKRPSFWRGLTGRVGRRR